MNRGTQINVWYILFAVMGIVFLRDIWVQTQTVESIPYSQFERYLEQGAIDEVTVGSNTIRGTFKNAQNLRDALAVTPLERILVETDAPFLTPVPHRGRPNAPYLMPHTVRRMAEALDEPLDELCTRLAANTERVYGSWSMDEGA